MRFRLMYLFSFVLSAVAIWYFKNDTIAMGVVNGLAVVMINLGIILSLCFIAMTSMGSGAALRRTKTYASTLVKSILWLLVGSAIILGVAFFASKIVGDVFSLTPSFTMSLSDASLVKVPEFARFKGSVATMQNIASYFGKPQQMYLTTMALFVFCLLFSYYLNPSLRVIQPAYTLANSITEVGFRFFYTICNIYIVFLFVVAGAFFSQLFNANSEIVAVINESIPLIKYLGILFAVICLVVLPILFVFFTKFQQNPFPVIWSALITSLVSVFSGNILFTLPVMEQIHRHQNNALKRTTVVSGNIMCLFSRVGSAIIAYITSVGLISSINGSQIMFFTHLIILCLCLAFSFISGLFPGFEYIFIIVMLRAVMPDYFNSDIVLLAAAYSPVLRLFGLFVDTFIINFGTKCTDLPLKKVI